MKTLIVAIVPSLDARDAILSLIACEHDAKTDCEQAVKAAFAQWVKTPEGKEFAEDNGDNWGDSLSIPDEFLRRNGITRYDALLDGGRVTGAACDRRISVDHDESLAGER